VFRARPVERSRPDFERAGVRPDRQPGQPRRGREGVLLLSRRHAQPQLFELPVQVSPSRIPLRRTGGGKPPPGSPGPAVQPAGRWRFRRQSLLGRGRVLRQGRPGGNPRPRHRRQPWSRGGDPAPVAATVVPQHLGLGRRGKGTGVGGTAGRSDFTRPETGQAELARDSNADRRSMGGARRASDFGRVSPVRPAIRRTAVRRKRAQRPTAVGTGERHALRQRQLPSPGGERRARRGQSRVGRHQVRRLARADRGRRPAGSNRAGAERRAAGPAFRRQRDGVRRPPVGGGCVLPRSAAGCLRRGPAYPAPSVGRHDLEQAVLPLRRGSLAGRRPVPAARESQRGPQPHLAASESVRRHLHARQVGVSLVRGLGSGLPLRRGKTTSTPTARFPPTNGRSAT
jgi:hypothetical protein